MRICNYPGRAVDATLALDQKSPMETLYQNNWLNADKTIKTIGRKSAAVRNHLADNDVIVNPNNHTAHNSHSDRKYFSQSSGGSNTSSSAAPSSSDDENRRTSISSLGRYQLTLEQMQKLDLNQSNELFRKTMRNLNGYKPSTIRQKHRRNYAGWDEFKEKATDNDDGEEIRPNQNAHRSSPPNENVKYYQAFDSNGNSKKVILIPKIKRSQTMRVTSSAFPSLQSPSTPPLSATNVNGSKTLNGNTTINLRNVFNRQHSQEPPQQQQQQQARMPTATINKNFNRFKRNNLPIMRNGINNNDGNDHDDDYDDDEDSVPNTNGGHHGNNSNDRNGNGFVATPNGYRANECIVPSNFSQFTMKSNGCIKNDKQKPNGTCDNEFKSNVAPTATVTAKKKPLLRAKSVRINPTPLQDIYYDRMMADRRESNGDDRGNQSQKTTTTNGISTTNCDKRSINSSTNHANGSNGTSGRLTLRQKLPRLTSIMKKKPIVITEELPQRPPQPPPPPPVPADGKPILDQWINFHYKKSKDQPSQPAQQQRPQFDNNNGKSVPNKTKSDKNSSTSSLSSISSGCADCNSNVSDFSIPRPRLIVPVHTYARKRRTGNLIQVNQSSAGAGDYDDRIDNNNAVIIKQPRNSSNTNNNKYNNGKPENKAKSSSNDKTLRLLLY